MGCADEQESAERQVPRVRISIAREVTPEVSSRHLVLLDPWRRAQLSPRYGGQIATLFVDEQDEVLEGDLLVRLADADSRGSLMSAQASRTGSEKRLRDLERQLVDAQSLYDSGAGTRREVERLETEIGTTRASVRQAAGQIIQSKDRRSANAILAPFAGVITSLEADLGEYAAPGARLATLSQLDKLAIDVPLSEAELVVYDEGGLRFEVEIRGAVTPVTLAWVAREADPGTNTFKARLSVDNSDKRLRAGESVRVSVRGVLADSVITVPSTALRWEGPQAYVLRATSKGEGEAAREHLERVDVRVHEDVQGGVAVDGELGAGDRVVSSGLSTLVDGDVVIHVPRAEARGELEQEELQPDVKPVTPKAAPPAPAGSEPGANNN